LPDEQIVAGTILRAGLPLHQGVLNVFDDAENAFVSAYRKYDDEVNFDIHIEYIASPALDGKTLLLTDPMLATGGSMELAYEALLTKGTPERIHLLSIIASREAVDYVAEHFPSDTTLWVGAIDEFLDPHKYIVPGLGDAGDLSFGEKE
jgi:uracil phosphoribosyltransferase